MFSASVFRLRILWDKNHIKIFCSEIWVEMIFGWPTFKIMCNFRCQIENQVSNYRLLGASSLVHLAFRPCELLSSLFIRRPSINISHFNLLLRNHWANCNQTLVEWSLDDPLPKLCPVIPTSNQDGRQAKNRKKGGWHFNCPLLL
jgi:hypothetical protein